MAPFSIHANSDLVGSAASVLCAVHCLATPLLFAAQACVAEAACCATESTPAWWSSLDYVFIGITFLAVYFSARKSSKQWVKVGLYGAWALLSALMINERMALYPLSEYYKYGAALLLVSLHVYNLRYCRCEDCVVPKRKPLKPHGRGEVAAST
jgi:hypothetical protein